MRCYAYLNNDNYYYAIPSRKFSIGQNVYTPGHMLIYNGTINKAFAMPEDKFQAHFAVIDEDLEDFIPEE